MINSRRVSMLRISLAIAALVFIFSACEAYGDVTGSFKTHVLLQPTQTSSEMALIDFDVQNALDVTWSLSGLSGTVHTHFGIAGVEDVLLKLDASLGALDAQHLLVLGRFPYNWINPFYGAPRFILAELMGSINLGGVTFISRAQIEDTHAFKGLTPAIAFGNVLHVQGQTLSGVSAELLAGICMEENNSQLKKHVKLTPYSVNPHCATSPKPDLLFDFEKIILSGIPVAQNVTGQAILGCFRTFACVLDSTLFFKGGPVPLSTSLRFRNLLNLSFSGATIGFTSGPGQLLLYLAPTGTLAGVISQLQATLNPDTNHATLFIRVESAPGEGLIDLDGDGVAVDLELLIERKNLELQFRLIPAGLASETGMNFKLSTLTELLNLEFEANFGQRGLRSADFELSLSF